MLGMFRALRALLATALLWSVISSVLTGCAGLSEKDEMLGWSVEKMYAEAKEALDTGVWDKAIKYYERMEGRYPYGKYAEQAQLEVAYAYWKSGEALSALAACDRFLKLHPNHASAAYALYLKGLINFNLDDGLFASISGQDPADRDPKSAKASFDAFNELLSRFPDSKYREDSIKRMTYLVNALARYEVNVAKYYLKREAYLAAINRAQFAIKTYPDAAANEDALFIMVKSYDALKMEDLRNDAERVMRNNFPKSKYFRGSVLADLDNNKRWWTLW